MKQLILIFLLIPSLAFADRHDYVGDAFTSRPVSFSNLLTACTHDSQPGSCAPQADGTAIYCSNCTPQVTPCTGGGTGAWALHQSGAWSCGATGGGGGGVTDPLPINKLNPKSSNCSDAIGNLSGSRSGEINGANCSAFNYELYGMESVTVTSSSGTGNLSCSGGNCKHFGVGQPIAIALAQAAPTATSTPSLTIQPVTVTSTYADLDGQNSVFVAGNTVFNPKCMGTSGASFMTCTNILAFEVGDTIIAGPNSYTVTQLDLSGNNHVLVTPNLVADVTGRNFSDGVTNTDTSLVSATANFTANDVGRPVYCVCANNPGATACVTTPSACPIATGTTVQSVTNSTTVVLSLATTGTGSGAIIALGSAPITGANITTTRRYKASFIYANGAFGPASGIAQTTASANSLNRYNQVDVIANTDPNAIAVYFSMCKGAACTNFVPICLQATDTMVWNAQSHTGSFQFLNDPDLISAPNRGGSKIVPTSIFCHDRGTHLDLMPHDFSLGTSAPPDAGSPGWYLGTIEAVGSGTVHVTPNVPLTVTQPMVHNGGAVLTEGWINAEIAAQTGWVNPIMTGLYVPQGQYRAFNSVAPPASVGGPHIYGDGGRGDDVGSVGASSIVNMITGGIPLALDNQDPLFEINGIMVRDGGGSTARVCLDLDSPNTAGAATGSGYVHEATFAGCNEGVRSANVNAQNVEFIYYLNDWVGLSNAGSSSGGVAERGWDILSGNSLGSVHNHVTAFAQTGIWSMAGITIDGFSNFPQTNGWAVELAPFLSTQFNFENARLENPSAVLRSLTNAGGGGEQKISIKNLSVVSAEYDPSCAMIDSTAGGSIVTDKNSFLGALFNQTGETQDASVCPNGFVHFSDLTGGWDTRSDTFDNIGPKAYGNPFTAAIATIGATHITTGNLSWYYYNTLGQNHLNTLVPPPTQPLPTFLTINSGCTSPIALTLTQVSKNAGPCVVAHSGGMVTFGISNTNSGGGLFKFDANNQLYCTFWADGTAGAEPPRIMWQTGTVGRMCSVTANNPGTLNFYSNNNGLTYTLQNNTDLGGGGTTSILWGYDNEAW